MHLSKKMILALLSVGLVMTTAEAAPRWLNVLNAAVGDEAQPAAPAPAPAPAPLISVPGVSVPNVAAPTAPAPAVAATAQLTAEEAAANESGEPVRISMKELQKRLKKSSGHLLLDVRTEGEFDSGHIAHATNIPVNEIRSKIGKKCPDKDRVIYVYCKSGARAETACSTLISLGYRRVYHCGGILSWPGKITEK